MRILIPAATAIQILQSRLEEIDALRFNPKAWKDRTQNDLREMFPIGSFKWLQVSQINFETYVTSEKAKVLAEGKETARQLISSYIDFIRQYSQLDQQKEVISESDCDQKYIDLRNEWNDLVPKYNKLIEKYDSQLNLDERLRVEIEAKNNEIERMKSETIQLDNVSFSRLSKAFYNLPVWQIVATFSVLFGIVAGSFGLGSIYQKNEDNNHLYDFKTEINNLKVEKESVNKLIYEKDEEIKRIKSIVDSLNNTMGSK